MPDVIKSRRLFHAKHYTCRRLGLFLAGEKRVNGGIEFRAPLEEVEFHDKDVAEQGTAEFLDKRACCCCRATCDCVSVLSRIPCIWQTYQ
jgi:hypothetical protein